MAQPSVTTAKWVLPPPLPPVTKAKKVTVDFPKPPTLPLSKQSGTNLPAPSSAPAASMQAINNIAKLTMANTQTQNDALQTNNQAIAQILKALEENQKTIQTLIKEIARLNAANITLQNQLATNAEAHQTQIETLTTQVGALQQQVVCLENSLRYVSEEHRSHVHIIDRGHHVIELNGFGPRTTPTTVNDYPTKVTEGPLPKDRLYNTDRILYPNDYSRRKYGIETQNGYNDCKTQ